MSKNDFLLLLDDILEVQHGTLTGAERLRDVNFDSLAVVEYMALVDEKFGVEELPPEQIKACKTIDDLIALVGDRITA